MDKTDESTKESARLAVRNLDNPGSKTPEEVASERRMELRTRKGWDKSYIPPTRSDEDLKDTLTNEHITERERQVINDELALRALEVSDTDGKPMKGQREVSYYFNDGETSDDVLSQRPKSHNMAYDKLETDD